MGEIYPNSEAFRSKQATSDHERKGEAGDVLSAINTPKIQQHIPNN